ADLQPQRVQPALALIGEPTEMRVVSAHKSGSVLETLLRGREGHSSAPALGASAVMMAGEFVALLARYQTSLTAEQDECFDPPYTTLPANVISGGTAVKVLARDARLIWEYRALPHQHPASILQGIMDEAEST